jgi:hypothetical protein
MRGRPGIRVFAPAFELKLADDPRIDDGRGDNAGRGGPAACASRAAASTRRLGVEQEVAHRAAPGRTRELREDRQADRQPQSRTIGSAIASGAKRERGIGTALAADSRRRSGVVSRT